MTCADDIVKNLRSVRAALPQGVSLVAISKFHPREAIEAAYSAGQRIFGESREQELSAKQPALPSDIRWHFIGHLQTNKVRLVVPHIDMVESGDSVKLLREIDKQAQKIGRTIDVLMELHIAAEETKYGFTLDDCRQFLASNEWRQMPGIRLRGLMMMASNVDDERRIAHEFDVANNFFNEVKAEFFPNDDFFDVRSWGMSNDYHIAVRHGSTAVRVGTAIFGPREL